MLNSLQTIITFTLCRSSWRSWSLPSASLFLLLRCWASSFTCDASLWRSLIWPSKELQRRPRLNFLLGGRIVWTEPRENLERNHYNYYSRSHSCILLVIQGLDYRVHGNCTNRSEQSKSTTWQLTVADNRVWVAHSRPNPIPDTWLNNQKQKHKMLLLS